MTRVGQILIGMLGALTLISSAKAVENDSPQNPYKGIAERNLFSIHDPPPKIIETVEPPMPKMFITGIISGFGARQAVIKLMPTPGTPAPTEKSFLVAVGQTDGDLELLELDDKQGKARVRYAGKDIQIEFQSSPATTPKPTTVAALTPSPMHRVVPKPVEAPAMTPEQQVIMMELERVRNKGNPNSPPIPPTELTSPEDAAAVMAPNPAAGAVQASEGRSRRGSH